MRVRLLKGYVHDGRYKRPGAVVDVSEDFALGLIKRGFAEPEEAAVEKAVTPPAPETASLGGAPERAERPRGRPRERI